MMQPNELELIHGEIDGANSAKQSSEFRELILRNPEARKLYEDLNRLGEILDDIHEVPAPADLKSGVMEQVSLGQRSALVPRRSSTPWVGYAAALAAGIVLGAIGLSLSSGTPGPNPGEVAGTFATQSPSKTEIAPITSLQVGGGSIGVVSDGESVELVISGDAEDWKSLDLEFDPEFLVFDPSAPGSSSAGRLESIDRGRMAIDSIRSGRIQGKFVGNEASSTVLTFSVYRDGFPASTGTFSLTGR